MERVHAVWFGTTYPLCRMDGWVAGICTETKARNENETKPNEQRAKKSSLTTIYRYVDRRQSYTSTQRTT
jgi:hypothetical protein